MRAGSWGVWAMAAAVIAAAAGRPAAVAASRVQDLPAAREVVARHLAAIGGEAAFKAIKSIHQKGRLAVAAQGLGGDFEVFAARPARMLTTLTVPGLGQIASGYDGRVGWTFSPIEGPEVLKDRQLQETAEDAWFDEPLHGSERVRAMETVARVEFDGRPAIKIHVVFRTGLEQIEYYDVDAGYEIGSEADRALPYGVVHTVNVLRDYRPFGALRWPTTLVQRTMGIEQVVTIASCDYGAVPDSTFTPPPAVRALVGR